MKVIVLLAFIALFAACNGDDNSSVAPPNQESAYSSSAQLKDLNNSSPSTALESSPSTASEFSSSEISSGSIETTPSSHTSNPSEAQYSETSDDKKVVCKGPYHNVSINQAAYKETYFCENGDICAPTKGIVCSLEVCRVDSLYECLDSHTMALEDFNKKFILDTCEDNLCKIYCYNNELVLAEGDTLKIIECDNKSTYLRDGAIGRTNTEIPIPNYIEDTPTPSDEFAVNCERGEGICAGKAEDGWCYLMHATIECPYREN